MLCVHIHTVVYGPFITSQLASRNELECLMWCKFGNVTLKKLKQRNLRSLPCGGVFRVEGRQIECVLLSFCNTKSVVHDIEQCKNNRMKDDDSSGAEGKTREQGRDKKGFLRILVYWVIHDSG